MLLALARLCDASERQLPLDDERRSGPLPTMRALERRGLVIENTYVATTQNGTIVYTYFYPTPRGRGVIAGFKAGAKLHPDVAQLLLRDMPRTE